MQRGVWLLLLLSTAVHAEIYHYVDDRGHKVYVDRMSEIPVRYRKDVEQLNETPQQVQAAPSPAVQKALDAQHKIEKTLAQIDQSLKALETPVGISGNRVLVPVRAVYGNRQVETHMMLDTGASGTVFHRQALASLQGVTYGAGKAKVASGQSIDVQAINLDRIEIGPFKIGATRAMVIDHLGTANYDGLLGMDFLRQVQYRVDYDRKLIVWNPDQYQALQEQRQKLKQEEVKLQALLATYHQ